MSGDIVQSTSSVTRGLSDAHKQIPRELIAIVELRLASSPEFESQLRNFLLEHPIVSLEEPLVPESSLHSIALDTKRRFVARDFVFRTHNPLQY